MSKQTPPQLPPMSPSEPLSLQEKRTEVINVIIALAAIVYLATMIQRAYVLLDAGYSAIPTNMTQLKYIIGLSYSAEEMRMIISLKELFSK